VEVLVERCCGLDVHQRTVVACVLIARGVERPHKEIRTYRTMTDDLLALADWLDSLDVRQVAMEATGVYWQPIWNLLEDRFSLVLANAAHIKAVPGRKTDVKDAEWIADLLRHGLIRSSFVPDRSQRELRELTRYRTNLVRERSAGINRLHKTLEGANIKLGSVATDVLGSSARAMLQALVDGESDLQRIADLAKGRMRSKRAELQRSLNGYFGPHQRFLVARQLAHIDSLDALIDEVSAEISARLEPVLEQLERLDSIPGVGRRTAEALLAELGTDMRRFATPAHLASWAGMCPGNHESAGKRTTGRTRKGNLWLRSILIEAAHAAARTRDTYLSAQYHRLAARRGKNRAAVAVGHSLLIIIHHLLSCPAPYHDLGATYFDERERGAVRRRLVDRLQRLGYAVQLQPQSA
jgi:transposase